MLKLYRSTRGANLLGCIACKGHYHSRGGVYGYNAPEWRKHEEKLKQDSSLIDFNARSESSNFYRYVEAFRKHGFKCSNINPLESNRKKEISSLNELQAQNYHLQSLETFPTSGILHAADTAHLSLDALNNYLEKAYCSTMAVDFSAVESSSEYEWLCQEYEKLACGNKGHLTNDEKKSLAIEMLRCQNFDNFLATKFSNVKRYGGEGAEAMMGFFQELIQKGSSKYGLQEVIIGMPHRGRLNLLTGLLNFPPVVMFRKMKGLPEFPPDQSGAGDVLSHLSTSVDLGTQEHPLRVILLPNPSHLEAANPVACGKARGRHMSKSKGDYSTSKESIVGDDVLCVQIHGDGALTGQGVNQEILEMSRLPHYSVGGSIHLTVNNQVGFTTPGDRGRSHRHSSDLGKLVGTPVIHVNGDFPEEIVRATRLAVEYRNKFRKDIFIELHCYRRWGHNELDDPTFTNPILYSKIQGRRNVPDLYSEALIAEGVLSEGDVTSAIKEHTDLLNDHFKQIETFQPKRENLKEQWTGLKEPTSSITLWDSGLPEGVLKFVGAQSVQYPEGFEIHPHLKKHHVENRIKRLEAGTGIDWGTAEALALGSLLYQGFNVRISGQDVGRATFSHRHAMLVDQLKNEMFIPLNQMAANGLCSGRLEMANSPLSEEAVLGFEYGMSIDNPKNLIIWEAQFGDFFNGAQIILDTYLSSGESKWGLQSGITLLLPHGMDGAGPEHSSCRIERFLQMCDSQETKVDGDDVNWHVVNPTTSAQYFHLLRRQMVRNFRKPLVVVAPKILLRLSAAASTLADMAPGTHFLPVVGDTRDPRGVTKVIFVSGKHYFALNDHIQEKGFTNVALVRVEQICPFPTKELQDELSRYPHAKQFVWSQEEHRNMGAWSFVQPRFRNLVGVHLQYAGRSELCQPAVGVASVHHRETKQVLEDTFK